jgi:hypothetical protein
MKKIIGIKILAIALILVSLTTDTMAQTRIRFARGRSSATLSGTLPSGSTRAYIISVRRNQTMTINVTSGNNNIQLDIDDVDGHIEYGDGYSQIYTNNNGDHWITLKNEGNRVTKYTMTVTVR